MFDVLMKAKIIRIGNSQGIRIPAAILKQCDFKDEVEMTVDDKKLILAPKKKHPREGWAESFKKMHEAGDDKLIWPDFENDFDNEEWVWEE